MSIDLLVISATVPMLPVLVPGAGDNMVTATRAAMQIARTVKKIPCPVPFESREGAKALRLWADQHARELVNARPLNGRSSLKTASETLADRYKN